MKELGHYQPLKAKFQLIKKTKSMKYKLVIVVLFLFQVIRSYSQIHFIGEVRDNNGKPVRNITIVFANNYKCLSDINGMIDCNLNYDGGEEISIRIEPNNYLLTIDNPIVIKRNYDARPMKIGVVRKGTESVRLSNINAKVRKYINDLTFTFIENSSESNGRERIQSEVISDAVNRKLVSLDELVSLKNDAAFSGIAYYVADHPERGHLRYIISSYDMVLRNFTRLAYLDAVAKVVQKDGLDTLDDLTDSIASMIGTFEEEGDTSVKERCRELKDYFGLNQGWNEKCRCYRMGRSMLRFRLVNENLLSNDFMRPYYISDPLTNDVLKEFFDLSKGHYPHPSVLTTGSLVDSLDWRNYRDIAMEFKGLNIPSIFEIVNAEMGGSIVMDSSSAVFASCNIKMEDGIWPLCFVLKTRKDFTSLSKTNYLHRWRKEYELRKNDIHYYGIQVDPTMLWIQPNDGVVVGRDFYKGPFFFVKYID